MAGGGSTFVIIPGTGTGTGGATDFTYNVRALPTGLTNLPFYPTACDDQLDALLAAIDISAIGSAWSSIYMPQGVYLFERQHTLIKAIAFHGEGLGTYLAAGTGVANKKIFVTGGTSSPGLSFTDMQMVNTQTGGGILGLDASIGQLVVDRCFVTVAGAAFTTNPASGSFDVAIQNTRFLGQGTGSFGLKMHSNAGAIRNCDFSGFEVGCQVSGDWTIGPFRAEVNQKALLLGQNPAGATETFTGRVDHCEFEGNKIDVHAFYCNSANFSNIGAQKGLLYLYGSEYVLYIQGGQDNIFETVGGSGDATTALFRCDVDDQTFRRCGASNTLAGYPTTEFKGGLRNMVFEACEFDSEIIGSVYSFNPRAVAIRSLHGVNIIDGFTESKNFNRIDTVVTSGTTSLDVVFHPQYLDTDGDAGVPTVAAGGVPGLPNGTYYVKGGLRTETGETGTNTQRTVVLAGANNKITVPLGTPAACDGRYQHIVYLSNTSGWAPGPLLGAGAWGGYYKQTIGSSASLVLQGQAFDGQEGPQTSHILDSAAEPDTNYDVCVTCHWDNGGVWVIASERLITGFKIRWKTAPGADSTLSWHLHRR